MQILRPFLEYRDWQGRLRQLRRPGSRDPECGPEFCYLDRGHRRAARLTIDRFDIHAPQRKDRHAIRSDLQFTGRDNLAYSARWNPRARRFLIWRSGQ